jgi:hypothetical protein
LAGRNKRISSLRPAWAIEQDPVSKNKTKQTKTDRCISHSPFSKSRKKYIEYKIFMRSNGLIPHITIKCQSLASSTTGSGDIQRLMLQAKITLDI